MHDSNPADAEQLQRQPIWQRPHMAAAIGCFTANAGNTAAAKMFASDCFVQYSFWPNIENGCL